MGKGDPKNNKSKKRSKNIKSSNMNDKIQPMISKPIVNEECKKLLDSKITEQSNLLRTERLDVSFGELLSMYENGEIIINPEFQRYFRWTDEQKTRFIESLLLGIPIPPIFVATNNDGIWELVDGLQRLSTFFSFVGILKSQGDKKYENKWPLQDGDRIDCMEGFTYDDLPQKYRFALKRSVCRVEILNWNSSYDMRYELFNRLNTGGTPLTNQEIRNCIFRDISPKFNDFLKDLKHDKNFITALSLSSEQTDCLFDEELILRFMSLYLKGDQIKTSISLHMTKFMKEAIEDVKFDYDSIKRTFNEVFKILAPVGSDVYRQKNSKKFATSLYDVITIGIAKNIAKYKDKSADNIREFIFSSVHTDENILKCSRRGGNNQKERIINRLKVAEDLF